MNSEAGRFSYCAGIFLICAGTAIITLVPSVFPALILGSMEGPKYPGTPDVFELGVLAYPVLITNIILTVLVILHATKKIPKSFYGPIRYMQNHDVSRKAALVTIVIIFAGYLSFTAGEIYQGEPWEDYTRTVKPRLDSWSVGKMFDAGNPLAFLLLASSKTLFGNYKVIPLISSLVVLAAVYLVTSGISGKRIGGIVSATVVLSSVIFQTYDTSITYPSFWIMFYVLSLLAVHRAWFISPVFFVLAVMSKPLPILFLPMTIFYIYNSEISQKRKAATLSAYGGVLVAGVFVANIVGVNLPENVTFDPHQFWSGFAAVSTQFRFDWHLLIFLLPLVAGLFFVSRYNRNAQSVMVLLLGVLLAAPLVSGFTTYTNNPYRLVPLVIFFAMGAGVLFSGIKGGASRSSAR